MVQSAMYQSDTSSTSPSDDDADLSLDEIFEDFRKNGTDYEFCGKDKRILNSASSTSTSALNVPDTRWSISPMVNHISNNNQSDVNNNDTTIPKFMTPSTGMSSSSSSSSSVSDFPSSPPGLSLLKNSFGPLDSSSVIAAVGDQGNGNNCVNVGGITGNVGTAASTLQQWHWQNMIQQAGLLNKPNLIETLLYQKLLEIQNSTILNSFINELTANSPTVAPNPLVDMSGNVVGVGNVTTAGTGRADTSSPPFIEYRVRECGFCKSNKETREFYTSHYLKNAEGHVLCPILARYVCPYCQATGIYAHTKGYCPKKPKTEMSGGSMNGGNLPYYPRRTENEVTTPSFTSRFSKYNGGYRAAYHKSSGEPGLYFSDQYFSNNKADAGLWKNYRVY